MNVKPTGGLGGRLLSGNSLLRLQLRGVGGDDGCHQWLSYY